MLEPRETDPFPLLQTMLRIKGKPLQATYTVAEVADLLDCSRRTINRRVASGDIEARDLVGRAQFFPIDIEAYLSRKWRRKP